ncbi:Thioesterase superfamily [Alteribacillus persepolensis]|uniref:Thioesterase superfamily n=1 Tax=Alteribacillus persepolensis TaxID=568899 RepID=A0A1G8GCD8_9BACI|nr:thioesterase [Alteribacillus persepolensis]SDH92045.1 Thioesterase superfamily [Alteribacillus persepolensis]
MKPGLEEGKTMTMTFTVTEDMFAAFEGELIHPTYSTVSMVYHMELISRKLILPCLESEEEAMGASVSVEHSAPSPLGTTVTVKATLAKIRPRSVTTHVVLENERETIGEGEVKQAVLPKVYIDERLHAEDTSKS